MRRPTYEQLVARVEGCVFRRITVDYADRNSVRRFNADYFRCKKYIGQIGVSYPERQDAFCAWVFHADWETVALYAPMVLDLEGVSMARKQQAVSCIRSLLDNPEVDPLVRLGFSMNFKNHEYSQYDPLEPNAADSGE